MESESVQWVGAAAGIIAFLWMVLQKVAPLTKTTLDDKVVTAIKELTVALRDNSDVTTVNTHVTANVPPVPETKAK